MLIIEKTKKAFTFVKDLNSLSLQSKVQIIMSSRLKKHYNYLLIDNNVKDSKINNIKKQRQDIGLDTELKVLRHLKLRDPSTEGCGCKLCLFRHKEYLNRIKKKKLKKELNYLDVLTKKVIKVNDDGTMDLKTKRDPFKIEYLTKYKGGLLVKVKNPKHKATRKSITGKPFVPKVLKYNNDIPTLLNNIVKQKQVIEEELITVFGNINRSYQTRQKLNNLLWLPI